MENTEEAQEAINKSESIVDVNQQLADDLFGDDSALQLDNTRAPPSTEVVQPELMPNGTIDEIKQGAEKEIKGLITPSVIKSEDGDTPKIEEGLDEDEAGDEDEGLFGDGDDDVDEEGAVREDSVPDDGLTLEERERRRKLEYDEADDYELNAIPKDLTIAQVNLASFPVPHENKVWHARLPNFLSLSSAPFDELMWEPELSDNIDSQGSDSSNKRKANVPNENVIRWRWSKDELGNAVKESNARIVRWTDGSLSLQLGAELFDMTLAVDQSAMLTSTAPVGLSTTTELSSFDQTRVHGMTYLTTQHDYLALAEAQASIHGTMTFRPATLQSDTHRRLAGNIAGRFVRGRAIKLAQLPDQDPDRKKQEREKAELDKAKKLKREAQRSAGGGSSRKRYRGLTRFSDGEDDDDGDVGLAYDRRNQSKRGSGGPLAQDDDYDADDFVVADDNSDEEGEGQDRDMEESDGGLDEVEEADERIEREEQKRKEKRKGGRSASPEQLAMAPRRRLVVADDEDDEN